MKITFILPSYPKKPVGGFKIVYQYANELVKRGHEVSIVHPAFMPNYPLSNNLSSKIKLTTKKLLCYYLKVTLPFKGVNWQYIDPRVQMIYVPFPDEKFIPDGDVVIATAWHTAEYVNIYTSKKGKKFYFIQHYEIWSGPKDRVDKTWLMPLKKIVIASWLKDLGIKLGAKDITVVPNAIEHDKFYLTNKIEDRPKRISMLYHKSDWKGSSDGIKALEIVKKIVPDIQAVFFGVPERGKDIPDWIEYVQTPSQEYLRDNVYNNSSIFLCPSWTEGWGLPVSEAMACGCAIVSTKNGGVQDFAIHEETALLSPIKDPEQLANNIIRLLKDEKLRIRLAYAGNEKIKQFNFNHSTDLFERVLKNELNY
ncbi:glycosyltransferase family 4 protein [Geobacillus stearothermophilus]|uniref:glycosyltransferase family 4 protein n=1 Tax=Geobacillus stearothermophilus TaxID=1422 RepID=UPI0005192753|nr:glycosyltransferase family 4 protein [Geobacillus stearothermophilus]MED4332606.1 glycosyltransferase family 4 protein [Geobacillus stearothermophilus]MED4995927.1 glycosyltransferase family 4 protein [Geobacillus stearothermophilus]